MSLMKSKLALLGATALLLVGAVNAQGVDKAKNMKLEGYSDLQGRTAYQPTIQKQGDRWIAYVGHHGDNKLNPLNGKWKITGHLLLM